MQNQSDTPTVDKVEDQG